uniref:Uncharacterized protein n=1 Tax=Onchocerca volvulus TaxID=6282 RepID=A0A8R1XVN6_ONCVO
MLQNILNCQKCVILRNIWNFKEDKSAKKSNNQFRQTLMAKNLVKKRGKPTEKKNNLKRNLLIDWTKLEPSDDFLSNRFGKYNDLFNPRHYIKNLNDVITELVQKIIGYLNVSLILHI